MDPASKRVLVVDDEPETLDLVKYVLEKEGFAVSTCATSRLVMDEIAKLKPSLLILDIMLPGLDGYSLQLRLAQDPATKDMPVVILTALESSRPMFDQFPQVKAFCSKPFQTAEFVQTVRKSLQ